MYTLIVDGQLWTIIEGERRKTWTEDGVAARDSYVQTCAQLRGYVCLLEDGRVIMERLPHTHDTAGYVWGSEA